VSGGLPAEPRRRGPWLLYLLRTMLFGWVEALVRLVRMIRRLCRRFHKVDRDDLGADTTCVAVDHPTFVTPDPLIYSQRHLAAQGLAVTWDNPDIQILQNGAPVDSHLLQPSTTYEVRARIWNDSLDAPVVEMPVHLSYLDFGVGTQSLPIGTTRVDVGVKGSAAQPGYASIPWTTPATPGHYCIEVLLDPAADKVPSNNVGQENTDVQPAQSPATFRFTLRNDTRTTQRYRFETDAYELGAREPCKDGGTPERRVERHRRGAHPVPEGFGIAITPASPELMPNAEVTVEAEVEPPPGFTGTQRVNVNAYHEQGFAGGVSLTVVKGP
jgi:hypothetical protein